MHSRKSGQRIQKKIALPKLKAELEKRKIIQCCAGLTNPDFLEKISEEIALPKLKAELEKRKIIQCCAGLTDPNFLGRFCCLKSVCSRFSNFNALFLILLARSNHESPNAIWLLRIIIVCVRTLQAILYRPLA